MRHLAEQHQSAQVWICHTCNGTDPKTCGCQNAEAHSEAIAAKREANRQANRRYREKAEQNQQSRDNHADIEIIENSDAAADRAEARCAAQWNAFTAQEERNAVSDVLTAIAGLTDEQRALLFQTLKDSYQWT